GFVIRAAAAAPDLDPFRSMLRNIHGCYRSSIKNRGGGGEVHMTVGTTAYPCQNCCSTIAWDPATGVMACDHCGNRQAVAPVGTAVREHAFAELASLPAKPVAKLGTAFSCPNCSAQTESDLLSANCQFCGTPL